MLGRRPQVEPHHTGSGVTARPSSVDPPSPLSSGVGVSVAASPLFASVRAQMATMHRSNPGGPAVPRTRRHARRLAGYRRTLCRRRKYRLHEAGQRGMRSCRSHARGGRRTYIVYRVFPQSGKCLLCTQISTPFTYFHVALHLPRHQKFQRLRFSFFKRGRRDLAGIVFSALNNNNNNNNSLANAK